MVLGGMAVAAATAAVWGFAVRGHASRLLPPKGPAAWVVYPSPFDTQIHPAAEVRAVFHRRFVMPRAPAAAMLEVRAFGRAAVSLNGARLPGSDAAAPDARQSGSWDVAGYLHPGDNAIAVEVANTLGPPALWLSLHGPDVALASDDTWDVSVEGATPRPVRRADNPVPVTDPALGGAPERTIDGLRACWPWVGLFAAVGAAVAAAGRRLGATRRRAAGPRAMGSIASLSPRGVFLGVVILWVLLFGNNLRTLVFPVGFDRRSHLNYIRYVQEHRAVPLANEGWEMHQPPLYYLTAAAVLSLAGLSPADHAAVAVLRLLGLALGLAQVALVFACLRLLFPDRPRAQVVGLVVAAFLPLHLYLYHYVTNETLTATLGTAAVYLCLRLLRDDAARPGRYALLGLVLGAGLLTKISALVPAGLALAVLAGRLMVRRERRPRAWFEGVALPAAVCVAVCGWYYARVWRHFGTPFVGSFDPASGFHWWQEPGYTTPRYLARFGRSLASPFFSGVHGFPDAIYSTLWGDGLWGGAGEKIARPPWNYGLMAAGYVLALMPTLAAILGAGLALAALVRRPRAEWFFLLGLALALGGALLYHYVRLPYYGHAKAFYGLAAVAVLCAQAGWAYDGLAGRWRILEIPLAAVLTAWALTSYGSFWVRGDSATARAWQGWMWAGRGNAVAAADCFRAALRADPRTVSARLGLAAILAGTGNGTGARQELERALEEEPSCAAAYLRLARLDVAEDQIALAVAHADRAAVLDPDDPEPLTVRAAALARRGDGAGEVRALRAAVDARPADGVTHHALAAALARQGEATSAQEEYRRAARLAPDRTDFRKDLARLPEPAAAGRTDPTNNGE